MSVDTVLHKLAEELPKLTFQVIRRTIATLAKGHVKGVQGMMRHSQVSTTTNVYIHIRQPEVRSTVDSIHKELSKKFVPEPSMPADPTPDVRTMEEVSAMAIAVPDNAMDRVAEVSAKPVRECCSMYYTFD